ncbi:hypothetical protein [Azospirillum sp. B506]|uniref:hypothetical protein n=1 Tax=Azospirillum sp. B506 TaxID=137721 RepID=UPI00034BF655|nr:hypothetical protein [Azospirillum sp. B506]
MRKTFELAAAPGLAQDDVDSLLAALDADPSCALDGVHDTANMPLAEEPRRVLDDLDAVYPPTHHFGARSPNQ